MVFRVMNSGTESQTTAYLIENGGNGVVASVYDLFNTSKPSSMLQAEAIKYANHKHSW